MIDVPVLARAVVDEIVPLERPAVDSLLSAYADDYGSLARQLSRSTGSDLGFGTAEAAALAPVIVHVASVVVGWLGAQALAGVGEPIKKSSADMARRVWRRLRRDRPPTSVVLIEPLNRAQLDRVYEVVVSVADLDRMPHKQAELIAQAVVGILARERPAADAS
jgi:hypothetical protein